MEITAITIMDIESRSLLRLMTWLSPAFPIGAFAYSGGLERAVHDGQLCDADGLRQWIATLLSEGTWWNDAVLLAAGWHTQADARTLAEIVELAEALAGSAERHLEVVTQGQAFVAAASAWPDAVLDRLGPRPPYAPAVGAVAAAHGVPLDRTIAAFLHAVASQAVSAAIRLGVLGQRQGVEVLAGLEAAIIEVTAKAAGAGLDDLGSAAILADLAAIRHETQHSRLFRS